VSGVKLEVIGSEKIDPKRNYIYVSNHLSYFDIPVFMQASPTDYRFIYKSSINYVPFFGWSLYLGGYIPINRNNVRKAIKSLQKGVKKVNKGYSLIIFPEGTRSRTGEINKFKKGIFYLAQHSKAKIVPVTIIGTNKIMPPDSFRINSGYVKVVFADPLDFEEGNEFLEKLKSIINSNYNLYK
jgi:1-acyl-sn-glycerol-3-phosphate acyltransferase